jgi:hypothetical protein
MVLPETRNVDVGPLRLQAILGMPEDPAGVIIFAHGSGSGRLSPRNNHVAGALRKAGLATLLLDLLAPAEEADRANVFDIALLASRLQMAMDWTERERDLLGLPLSYRVEAGRTSQERPSIGFARQPC